MTNLTSRDGFWWTVLVLSFASALAIALAALGAYCSRRLQTRQRLWRAALIATLLLLAGEFAGIFAALGGLARQRLAPIQLGRFWVESRSVPAAEIPPTTTGSHDASAAADDTKRRDRPAVKFDLERWNATLRIDPGGTVPIEIDTEFWNPPELSERPDMTRLATTGHPDRAVSDAASLTEPMAARFEPDGLLFALAWLLMSGLLAIRLCLIRGLWWWRSCSARPVVDSRLLDRVADLGCQLGFSRKVRVYASAKWLSPVAWGVWRPSIGLPVDFASRFDSAKQDAILAHELKHLSARDPVWQWLADSVAILLWWLPWCWWLRRQMRMTAEWMADEACLIVSGGPRALAECLVVLGREMIAQPTAGFAGHAVTGTFRSTLGQRVRRLLDLESAGNKPLPEAPNLRGRLTAPALVMFIVLVVVVGSAWARPRAVSQEQGDQNMRWFEHSWRRSLAGVLVSMALGAGSPMLTAGESTEIEDIEVELTVTPEESSDEQPAIDVDFADAFSQFIEAVVDEAADMVENVEVEIELALADENEAQNDDNTDTEEESDEEDEDGDEEDEEDEDGDQEDEDDEDEDDEDGDDEDGDDEDGDDEDGDDEDGDGEDDEDGDEEEDEAEESREQRQTGQAYQAIEQALRQAIREQSSLLRNREKAVRQQQAAMRDALKAQARKLKLPEDAIAEKYAKAQEKLDKAQVLGLVKPDQVEAMIRDLVKRTMAEQIANQQFDRANAALARAAAVQKASLARLHETVAQLRKNGQEAAAQQVAAAAAQLEMAIKLMADQSASSVQKKKLSPMTSLEFIGKTKTPAEDSGNVERLQNEINQMRDEMKKLRIMVERVLSERSRDDANADIQ
jgi:segregation and condensation protein B